MRKRDNGDLQLMLRTPDAEGPILPAASRAQAVELLSSLIIRLARMERQPAAQGITQHER